MSDCFDAQSGHKATVRTEYEINSFHLAKVSDEDAYYLHIFSF